MGRLQREREAHLKWKHERRWAWLKGLTGAVFFPIILVWFFLVRGYKENKWPWEEML
jgi:hypothetical protein